MKDLLVLIDQEVFHSHPQQPCQSQQVVYRRQTLAMLPLVDGLWVFKPEKGLNIPNGQPLLPYTSLPQTVSKAFYPFKIITLCKRQIIHVYIA